MNRPKISNEPDSADDQPKIVDEKRVDSREQSIFYASFSAYINCLWKIQLYSKRVCIVSSNVT